MFDQSLHQKLARVERKLDDALRWLWANYNLSKEIAMKQEELEQGLKDVAEQVAKIGAESTITLQKVTDLETALANADNVSPGVQSAFDALKAQVQKVDDMIPDAPPPPV